MGALSFSIDGSMVQCLAEALRLDVFVETGTFEGEAVAIVQPFFREIHTIELSESYAAAARARFADDQGVHVYEGDSADVLGSLRPRLGDRAVLYWLDAHWCVAAEAEGVHSQCPLLRELAAIAELNPQSVVLIDDARLFLAPPPEPHDSEDWPRFHEVVQSLLALSTGHELIVVNDIIGFIPGAAAPAFRSWAGSHGFDLLASLHRLRELEEERTVLHDVLGERLEAINTLTRVAEERLEMINTLTRRARAT